MSAPVVIHSNGPGPSNDSIMSVASDIPVVIYVDGTLGDDTYDGSSPTVDGGGVGPKATYAGAKALVPFIRRRDYMIKMAAGTYAEQCLIDGIGNTIAVVGDYTVEQTGTIDHVDDGTNPGPINPGGLYQMQIVWDGGFTLTDLVDDEKWIVVEFADGTKQAISLLAVLAADTAEVALYNSLPTGKIVADYANASVQLVSPSVIFDPPSGRRALVVNGHMGVNKNTNYSEYTGIVLFGLEFTGDYVAMIRRYFGYYIHQMVKYNSTGYSLDYDESSIWSANTALFAVWDSSHALATYYALTGEVINANSNRSCGIVAIANSGAGGGKNAISFSHSLFTTFDLTGVAKGQIEAAYAKVAAFNYFNAMHYQHSDNALRAQVGGSFESINGNAAVIRKGNVSIGHNGYLHGNFGKLEFRAITTGSPFVLEGRSLLHLSSMAVDFDNDYAGPLFSVEDSEAILDSELSVTDHTVGQPAIEAVASKISGSGDLTFPDQDYGDATAGGGIIVADQKSHVRLTGAVTGQNTNAANSEPLVLRRGSEADLDAGYALQDGTPAATAIVGSAGSVGVPAAGNTVNDIGGAGTEEMCRISRL